MTTPNFDFPFDYFQDGFPNNLEEFEAICASLRDCVDDDSAGGAS